MFDVVLNPTNNHDVHYFVEVYSPIIIGLIAAGIAYIANRISKRSILEQKKQFNKQLKIERENFQKQFELQKIQWKYDNFFKYKQDKLLELRSLYRKFKFDIENFIKTFLPTAIGNADKDAPLMALPNMSNIDDDSHIKPIYFNTTYEIAPDEMLENFFEDSKNLYNFLIDNDIFIQDNPMLYDDLKSISRGFKELFTALKNNNAFSKLFVYNKEIGKYILIPENEAFRRFFYTYMHYRMNIQRGDLSTSLFYEIPNSVFKIYKLAYTEENVEKWISNNIILFNTSGIFIAWLETWEKYINEFFTTSISDISAFYKNSNEVKNAK